MLMKIAVFLLCLASFHGQDGVTPEALRGLEELLRDPMKNTEELQRRFLTLGKTLKDRAEFPERRTLLGWYARVGRNTGNYEESFKSFQELARTGKDEKEKDPMYLELLYSALISGEREAFERVCEEVRREVPGGTTIQWVPVMKAGISPSVGSAPTIKARTVAGEDFQWDRSQGKLLFLCFAAST
jgi:hypothetical protein